MKPAQLLLGIILGYVVANLTSTAQAGGDPDVYRSRVALESIASSLARCMP